MTCRHRTNDPNCSSHPDNPDNPSSAYYQPPKSEPFVYPSTPATPDSSNYEITDVQRVGNHLVMKVKYPNCSNCAYEGNKIMVFLNVKEFDAIKWRKIDPHFREPSRTISVKEAPSPVARFPGSPEGWSDAVVYAQGKK